MRANLPKPPRPAVTELEGVYLQAMKEVSVRLMDVLPDGDELWGTLGQVEAMLLEAQLREMPPDELFGDGGVAAFCQSIVDEFKAEGVTVTPAAESRLPKQYKRIQGPQGGINYRSHRLRSVALAIALILAFAVLALWFTGVLRYWTAGDSYYLEELHNFQSKVTDTLSPPITVTMPLSKADGLRNTLYADSEGYDITLTALETYVHAGSYTDPATGETSYRKMTNWILSMTYTVESDFKRITYVEPPSGGTVTVTLADGTTQSGRITWLDSGSAGERREYARISVIELPSDMDTRGATLTVVLDPPKRVEWNRISTGPR